ncbi:amino acid permease ScVBA-like protein [Laetiporus sulphureus 93-53]|uniref:Amino acid permease ScVBA-like protein n=1 Tax=Laetiporus sulphureus 93-53 TaxID=1314785 RepID=A0A165E6L8_9APHY|nr:amino acid permease ScVBA-like protein [Laetiporus sulphureus 93-53]KZT06339.1 amino acid permease ScVBA-like protein [Laetiporus sulphureus 93-53]
MRFAESNPVLPGPEPHTFLGPSLQSPQTPTYPRSALEIRSESVEVDFKKMASERASESCTTLVECDGERPALSTVRLLAAHFGAALTLFLATTDATIVSTILPTITSHFEASPAQYTWVSVTYLLTQTAFQPLYGKVSDLIGRMTVLYCSIFIFATSSALCGAAQSIEWLIAARALGGIGGGGIVSLVWTITAEIVEIRYQAKWSQALSVTWACSAIAGPLLGGVFGHETGALSWRWAFLLNIPVCAAATIVLWLSLHNVALGGTDNVSWRTFCKTFDFVGLFLFVGGSSSVIIGLNTAADVGWIAPSTLSAIITGLFVLVSAGLYEVRTTRDALFPRVIFTDFTILIVLVVIFLHNFAFNAGTYYLALFYQAVDGLTPLQAGVKMLPYSLGASLASMPAAWFIGYWQDRHPDISGQKITICLGLSISAAGFGLMTLLDCETSHALRSIYTLIAGVGIGMLFHAPYQVFTRALRRKDTASGTSAFFLVRFTGATVGLTLAGAIYDSRLSDTLPAGISAADIMDYFRSQNPGRLGHAVVYAISLSIRTIWIVCTPCLGVAFLASIFMRTLSVEPFACHQQVSAASTLHRDSASEDAIKTDNQRGSN